MKDLPQSKLTVTKLERFYHENCNSSQFDLFVHPFYFGHGRVPLVYTVRARGADV